LYVISAGRKCVAYSRLSNSGSLSFGPHTSLPYHSYTRALVHEQNFHLKTFATFVGFCKCTYLRTGKSAGVKFCTDRIIRYCTTATVAGITYGESDDIMHRRRWQRSDFRGLIKNPSRITNRVRRACTMALCSDFILYIFFLPCIDKYVFYAHITRTHACTLCPKR
jgi:hypothetical protein